MPSNLHAHTYHGHPVYSKERAPALLSEINEVDSNPPFTR